MYAYNCRLFGSYEALEGGWTNDALVDFTGGIGHRLDLSKRHEHTRDLFRTLQKMEKMSTLMGCSINVSQSVCLFVCLSVSLSVHFSEGLGSTVVTSPASEATGLGFESRWRQIISVRAVMEFLNIYHISVRI